MVHVKVVVRRGSWCRLPLDHCGMFISCQHATGLKYNLLNYNHIFNLKEETVCLFYFSLFAVQGEKLTEAWAELRTYEVQNISHVASF